MVRAKRVDNLFLINASDNLRDCWFYLEVKPEKTVIFERHITAGTNVNLEDWGRVIISGWGAEPPLKVREKIKKEAAAFSLSDEEKKQEIFFLKSVSNDGVPFFSFVTVPLYLADEFQFKCTIGGFDYNDYGAVVYSDWGLNPSERVLMLMEMDYNLDRNKIRHLLPPELVS